ncbi:MAG: SDR family NAD(P)-dependent oxidoreductase [Candidatus Bathyarchaeota archaeon]|nr:SDR family NAD(P)-dependent oxidoreductase [Candidatus Bathyarchaeota archaeon]
MYKVLVTGGAGFIGSNLVKRLLNSGYFVTVFDNLSSGKLENLNYAQDSPLFSFIQGDICDKKALHTALCEVNAIMHLAALIDVKTSVVDPTSNHDVNVTGTFNVLHEAVQSKVKKVVFASSTAVYGDVKSLPVTEDTALKPLSPYAASKAAGEAYCSAFSNCYDLKTVALRFFNVYGPKNENSPYSGVITKFLNRALKGENLTVEGDGEQTRDFIHVDDIVSALVLALENTQVKTDVFNVCTGTPTSVNALAANILSVTKSKSKITYSPARVGDIKHSYGDKTKTLKELGFSANVSLTDGLKTLIE